MESTNPVFKRGYAAMRNSGSTATAVSSESLEEIYNAPAASSMRTGRMTIDDVVIRTSMLFAVLVVVGGLAWKLNLSTGFLFVGFIAVSYTHLTLPTNREV